MRRRRRHKKTRLSPVRAARPLPVKQSSLRPYEKLLLAEQMRDPVRVARTGTPVRRSASFTDVEDLRVHDFSTKSNLRSPTYRTTNGARAEYGRSVLPSKRFLPGWSQDNLRFYDPQNTITCVRRRARRRVIFAIGRAGRGGRGNRPAKWSDRSRIQCK